MWLARHWDVHTNCVLTPKRLVYRAGAGLATAEPAGRWRTSPGQTRVADRGDWLYADAMAAPHSLRSVARTVDSATHLDTWLRLWEWRQVDVSRAGWCFANAEADGRIPDHHVVAGIIDRGP